MFPVKSIMSNSQIKAADLNIAKEQTHLHLLASAEHEFSDEANGCRFSTHMNLLSTQTWSREKHETKQKKMFRSLLGCIEINKQASFECHMAAMLRAQQTLTG